MPAARKGAAAEQGAILLFVLFVAVALAVLAQALSVAVVSVQRARDAENTGRDLLAEKGLALLGERDRLLAEWAPHEWSPVDDGMSEVSTLVETIPDGGEWALDASATHAPETSPLVLSAWVERGRDGLDLPIAGLVASGATWTEGRETACVDAETAAAARPAAWLVEEPDDLPMGAGLEGGSLDGSWGLGRRLGRPVCAL